MRSIRAAGRAALLTASAALTACGPCLLVIRQDVVFVGPQAEELPGEIEWREPDGILSPRYGAFPANLLGEPFDLLFSTITAVNAMFDDDESVLGGPLGWIAALTPFATLVGAPSLPPLRRIELHGDAIHLLRGGDSSAGAAAVRAALRDERVGAARLH